MSSWLLLGWGIEVGFTSCSACYAMQPSSETKPTADGNSQPFRELHSITQQHRGCGGDCVR